MTASADWACPKHATNKNKAVATINREGIELSDFNCVIQSILVIVLFFIIRGVVSEPKVPSAGSELSIQGFRESLGVLVTPYIFTT